MHCRMTARRPARCAHLDDEVYYIISVNPAHPLLAAAEGATWQRSDRHRMGAGCGCSRQTTNAEPEIEIAGAGVRGEGDSARW